MIILEQIMEIKILNKHGKSLRTIAGEVGVSAHKEGKILVLQDTTEFSYNIE
ncbi:hypothetical protein [Rickettsia endosymbiont of Orchestes rusci]|uniref:hypothetical protein n=1 Tax=Rickettsia endosymbiont of Orchestes rusci TaxID=3066250 RepID=UPI00313CBF2A